MAMTWFRYHADVLNNQRVQKLPLDLFRLWVNCQCILAIDNAGASGKLPSISDCAYHLRMSVEETVNNFEKLVDAGLLLKRIETKDETKCNKSETESETKSTVSTTKNETLFETQSYSYFLKNWGKKQYKSDTSTERVKRFRDKKKTVSETPPDQIRSETESDTDQKGIFHSENKDKGVRRLKIETLLNDSELGIAKSAAFGWDIYHLMRTFDEFIADKEFPAKPAPAFIQWVKNYTKGKKP